MGKIMFILMFHILNYFKSKTSALNHDFDLYMQVYGINESQREMVDQFINKVSQTNKKHAIKLNAKLRTERGTE